MKIFIQRVSRSISNYKLIYLLILAFVVLAITSFYEYFVSQNINYTIESCLAVASTTTFFTYMDVVFFSHVSVAAVSLSLGLFVLFKKRTLESVILFSIALCITLWLALDQLTWSFSYNAAITFFAWSLLSFVAASFFVLNIYFFYVFLFKKDVSAKMKYTFFALLFPAIALTPTRYNLSGWDADLCQPIESPYLTYYSYAIGLVVACWIILLAFAYYKKSTIKQREILLLLTIGCGLSTLSFSLSNIIASFTLNWHFTQYGLFGVPVFIGFLSYLIIKYNVFDVKLIAAQALVIALIILGISQILFVRDSTNTPLRSIILVLFILLCTWLIYSIKTETRQKAQLSTANQKLKRLDEAKDDFINIASHQLKSPIAILKNTLEVSGSENIGETKQESLRQIARLETLVSEVLLASKLTQEKYSAKNLEEIDMVSLIKEIIDDQKRNKAYDIEIILRESGTSIPTFSGDTLYLREAFANIIHNAIKYSKRGEKGKIEITLGLDSAMHQIIFTCQDGGIGISPEDVPKLFSKFSRGSNVHADSGTGLGLYITKEIIEGHGGKISVESELGMGTKVTIMLPLLKT